MRGRCSIRRSCAAPSAASFVKLNPVTLLKNPVIFVVEVGAVVTTLFLVRDLATGAAGHRLQSPDRPVAVVHRAVRQLRRSDGRSARQGAGRRAAQDQDGFRWQSAFVSSGKLEQVPASQLRAGDIVVCEAGDIIPGDGEVIDGIATVDESVITGESAPVIRESGGDRSAVTGGTRVLSDQIRIKITSNPGETFLDRMIALVEGAERQKTPNEIALNILIAGLTLIFLLAVVTLQPFAQYSVTAAGSGSVPSVAVLVSLLVCLIPTTIGGLLSAIGIAGMDRVMQHNVLAMSGKAVEASGDVNTLLLDKTGTITIGNRQAVEFLPVNGVTAERTGRRRAAVEPGRRNARGPLRRRAGQGEVWAPRPRSGEPRSPLHSVLRLHPHERRRHRRASLCERVPPIRSRSSSRNRAAPCRRSLIELAERISRQGGTPLAVADGRRALGVIHLKDVVKGGMKERLAQLRAMGIRTVMITGDNPLTAAAIAAEAGVDDFLAQASPADKLNYIKKEQAEGRLVAMTGDGTNDAPALAQADVGLAMNTGTMAAKEAGNMVDLDSNPTKLIEVVAIGKQLLITRGALTTFSIANDVAKYFAIIPAMFMATYPALGNLNIMGLHNPQSAVLSAVIFNALIIIALVPLALRGVKYRPVSAGALLRRNLLVYGVGGIVAPFPGIWIIDQIVHVLGLA